MPGSPLAWRVGGHVLDCGPRTLVMGALNVTPDSFFDGGRYLDPEAAVARGCQMAEEGADIIDVGGESTRPGSDPVRPGEEISRVVPVVERLAAELSIPISIDSRKPTVAEAALDAGAGIVNDVSGGADPAMFDLVRDTGASMVIMHMRGEPKSMQHLTDYHDVVEDVKRELRSRLEAAVDAGIRPERLAVDPGLGFAKDPAQNLLLMREIHRFLDLGRPLLVGPSRKSFIGAALGGADVTERLEGTAGAVAWVAGRGAHIVRVHDVREMVRVLRVVDAIRTAAGREHQTW
jgi:dihydropteroate synthase